MALIIPSNYKQRLLPETTEVAIKMVKDRFQDCLAHALDLRRVTAPLFVLAGTVVVLAAVLLLAGLRRARRR